MYTIHIYRLQSTNTWVVEAIHPTHSEYTFLRTCALRDIGATLLKVILDDDITTYSNGYRIKEWCFR